MGFMKLTHETSSVTVGNGTVRHWPAPNATGDNWALCGTRGRLGAESAHEATCKRCLKMAPYGTDLTVTPMGTKLGTAEPVQVCVCGMMAGQTYHKRYCPAQEAQGIYDTGMFLPKTSTDGAGATVRDDAQDALDAEQQRTGIHAGCGLLIIDHCGRCDVCPIPSEGCECHIDPDPELVTVAMAPVTTPPTSFIPATERRALTSILGVDKPLPVAWPLPGHGGQTATVAEKRVRMRRWNRRVKPSVGRNRKGR